MHALTFMLGLVAGIISTRFFYISQQVDSIFKKTASLLRSFSYLITLAVQNLLAGEKTDQRTKKVEVPTDKKNKEKTKNEFITGGMNELIISLCAAAQHECTDLGWFNVLLQRYMYAAVRSYAFLERMRISVAKKCDKLKGLGIIKKISAEKVELGPVAPIIRSVRIYSASEFADMTRKMGFAEDEGEKNHVPCLENMETGDGSMNNKSDLGLKDLFNTVHAVFDAIFNGNIKVTLKIELRSGHSYVLSATLFEFEGKVAVRFPGVNNPTRIEYCVLGEPSFNMQIDRDCVNSSLRLYFNKILRFFMRRNIKFPVWNTQYVPLILPSIRDSEHKPHKISVPIDKKDADCAREIVHNIQLLCCLDYKTVRKTREFIKRRSQYKLNDDHIFKYEIECNNEVDSPTLESKKHERLGISSFAELSPFKGILDKFTGVRVVRTMGGHTSFVLICFEDCVYPFIRVITDDTVIFQCNDGKNYDFIVFKECFTDVKYETEDIEENESSAADIENTNINYSMNTNNDNTFNSTFDKLESSNAEENLEPIFDSTADLIGSNIVDNGNSEHKNGSAKNIDSESNFEESGIDIEDYEFKENDIVSKADEKITEPVLKKNEEDSKIKEDNKIETSEKMQVETIGIDTRETIMDISDIASTQIVNEDAVKTTEGKIITEKKDKETLRSSEVLNSGNAVENDELTTNNTKTKNEVDCKEGSSIFKDLSPRNVKDKSVCSTKKGNFDTKRPSKINIFYYNTIERMKIKESTVSSLSILLRENTLPKQTGIFKSIASASMKAKNLFFGDNKKTTTLNSDRLGADVGYEAALCITEKILKNPGEEKLRVALRMSATEAMKMLCKEKIRLHLLLTGAVIIGSTFINESDETGVFNKEEGNILENVQDCFKLEEEKVPKDDINPPKEYKTLKYTLIDDIKTAKIMLSLIGENYIVDTESSDSNCSHVIYVDSVNNDTQENSIVRILSKKEFKPSRKAAFALRVRIDARVNSAALMAASRGYETMNWSSNHNHQFVANKGAVFYEIYTLCETNFSVLFYVNELQNIVVQKLKLTPRATHRFVISTRDNDRIVAKFSGGVSTTYLKAVQLPGRFADERWIDATVCGDAVFSFFIVRQSHVFWDVSEESQVVLHKNDGEIKLQKEGVVGGRDEIWEIKVTGKGGRIMVGCCCV